MGWRGGLVLKSAWCSCRESGFSSQCSRGSSRTIYNSGSRGSVSSSNFCLRALGMHTCSTHTNLGGDTQTHRKWSLKPFPWRPCWRSRSDSSAPFWQRFFRSEIGSYDFKAVLKLTANSTSLRLALNPPSLSICPALGLWAYATITSLCSVGGVYEW